MTASNYVIRGGVEGRERLRVLARVMGPTTQRLLDGLVGSRSRCLDVGCGGGDVTQDLARRAPAGSALGIDLDETKLDLARAEAVAARLSNVEYRIEDVTEPIEHDERYDVVYARFVLSHLPDPEGAVANLHARLAPGGVLLVEDVDCSGFFCYPPNDAFARYVELYSKAVRARGADPNIGPRLPSMLRAVGLEEVQVSVVQPAALEGETKLLNPITLEAIADAVLGAGLVTPEELAETIDALWEFARAEGTLLSVPRVVQTWGRHSA
jgi:SAM-dependent methyltransferase